jgi:hypothetical protein
MPIGPVHAPFASRLPVPLKRPAAPLEAVAGAEFISQLIAERDHLPPQRARRRATVEVAVTSYDAAAAQAVRRLPPGYRRTLVV